MILALDFDGVLHPVMTTMEPKFCRLELLEGWLRGRPDVDVVISSSWREVHPFDILRSFFADDLQARVLGVTPLAHSPRGPASPRSDAERAVAIGERQHEIEQWVADCGLPTEQWVALDDDASLFRPGCPNLVVCEPTIGLTVSQLDDLDVILMSGESRTGETRRRS